MIKKIKNFSLLLLCLSLFVPLVSFAANDVTIGSGVSLELPSDGSTYSVGSNTTVKTVTINNTNFQFQMEASSVVTLSSGDSKSLDVGANIGTCSITASSCTDSASAITITCPSDASEVTVTITPSGTCSNPPPAGGGGGGGVTGDTTAPVISDISVSEDSTSATISWITDEDSISWIVYGETADYGTESKGTSYTTTHSVILDGLSSETTYHYQIKSKDSDGNVSTYTDQTFTTEAAKDIFEVTDTITDTYQEDISTSVTVGDTTHSVTVTSATEEEATITVGSYEPVLNLIKNEAQDIDTSGDGTNDLRMTYLGLVNGDPKLKLSSLEEAAACSLSEKKAYKHSQSSAVYYITEDCTKRPFNRSDVYFTYFDSWDDVTETTKSKLDSISTDTLGFMPWGPKYDPKYGALVKVVTDPKVYLLLGTEKYWITSETVFEGLKYAWGWIEDIDKALLDNYTTGSEINYTDHHPNYTIIKYADSVKVYRLEPDPDDSNKQIKRYIPDEATFESLGFRWDRIVTIDDTETYTKGEDLTNSKDVAGIKIFNYVFTSNLSEGDAGDEVKQLQLKLKDLGYFPADTNATGYYGPVTTQAVKDFQSANGIDPVGYVGPATREALNSK